MSSGRPISGQLDPGVGERVQSAGSSLGGREEGGMLSRDLTLLPEQM